MVSHSHSLEPEGNQCKLESNPDAPAGNTMYSHAVFPLLLLHQTKIFTHVLSLVPLRPVLRAPRRTFILASYHVEAAFTAAPLSVASLKCTSWARFWSERHRPSSSLVAPSSPAPRHTKHGWRSTERMRDLYTFDGFQRGSQAMK